MEPTAALRTAGRSWQHPAHGAHTQTLAFLNDYFNTMGVKILDVDFHAENRPEGNLYTNLYTLSMPSHTSYVDIIGTLSEHQNIRTVRTRNL